jgi:hypothetical protein
MIHSEENFNLNTIIIWYNYVYYLGLSKFRALKPQLHHDPWTTPTHGGIVDRQGMNLGVGDRKSVAGEGEIHR